MCLWSRVWRLVVSHRGVPPYLLPCYPKLQRSLLSISPNRTPNLWRIVVHLLYGFVMALNSLYKYSIRYFTWTLFLFGP